MTKQCDIRGCVVPATVTKVRLDSLGRQTPKRGIVHLCTRHGDDRWEETMTPACDCPREWLGGGARWQDHATTCRLRLWHEAEQ